MAGVFREEPKVRAFRLSGSFGYGLAGCYGDIDLLIVTEDGPSDEIAALCRRAISAAGEIVLWWDRSTQPMLINAITDGSAAGRKRSMGSHLASVQAGDH